MTPKHRGRLSAMAPFAAPEVGSPEWNAFHEQLEREGPDKEVLEWSKAQWKKTNALVSTQLCNGAGLSADSVLRDFLGEFNSRVINYGLRSMPVSFNGMEAFMRYIPPLITFRLFEEVDFLFSWVHFIDHVTSGKCDFEPESLLALIPERKILNFNSMDDPRELLLSGEEGSDFGPLSFSLIRHGAEVTVMMLGGESADLKGETEKARRLPLDSSVANKKPYLEKVDAPREAVELIEGSGLWRVIAIARFDFEDRTEEGRYYLQDIGDSFWVQTDDLGVFLDESGEFPSAEVRAFAEKDAARLLRLGPVFDICATAVQLPLYSDQMTDEVHIERRETEYKEAIKSAPAQALKKWIPATEMIAYRLVNVIEPTDPPLRVPGMSFAPPDFKMETRGYWKKLPPGKVGEDKKGRPVTGRTWVTRHTSWVERSRKSLHTTPAEVLPTGPDPGWIYVLRTAAHPPDVFKVGLTRRTPEDRANDLSRRTNALDDFLVVHEWAVSDCGSAEREVHSRLAEFRVNPKREFFQIPLRDLIEVVNQVIDGTRSPG